MLCSLLKALIGEPKKENNGKGSNAEKNRKKKLTQKEKDKLEYQLWVMAEEYEEEE